MLAYNLTPLSRGLNRISGPLDIVVWAMDEGGLLPHSVEVQLNGRFIELERVSSIPADTHCAQPEVPEASPPQSNSLTVSINVQCAGRTHVEALSFVLPGPGTKTLEPRQSFPLTTPEGAAREFQSHTVPEGLDPRFVYFVRLKLGPGVHRLRLLCTDRQKRKHWIQGFSVTDISAPIAIEPEKQRKTFKPLPQKRPSRLLSRIVSQIIMRLLRREKFVDRWVCFSLINPERLGHLAANTEIFLSEKQCGLHSFSDTRNVFFVPRFRFVEDHGWVDAKHKVANEYLLQLWKKDHVVLKEGLVSTQVLDDVSRAFPSAFYFHRSHGHRDIHGCLDRTPPSVSVPEDLKQQGDEMLEAMGIPKGAPIALIHHRTPDFVKETYASLANLDGDRYGYRNVDATSYDEAVRRMVAAGYHVIRVGKESNPWHLAGEKAVDFASQRKDEWTDLYLFERCKFFCGTTSGIYALADLFRKPIVFTNFAPLGHVYSWSPRHLTIFKRLRDLATNRIVPASELLRSELGWTIHWDKIPKEQFVYEDNTSEEIADAVEEMALRLDDRWEETPENAEMQQRFWSQIKVNEFHCHKDSHIGTQFLRKNSDWLLA